ncbi:MAG: hypothetical protein AB7F86_01340 [Bdellovibrionales bacterium]
MAEAAGGRVITLTCIGTGASSSVARQSAISDCKRDAANFLSKSTEVRSLTVETEERVSYHSSVQEDLTVKNLNCDPINEAVQKIDDSYEVRLQCRFDLSKAEVAETVKGPKRQRANASFFDSSGRNVATANAGEFIQSDKYPISISSIPMCTEVLIRGEKPRSVKCTANPTVLNMEPTDVEIIIRSSGFIPRKFKVSPMDRERSFHVTLEQN